jgi:DNA modification methylase
MHEMEDNSVDLVLTDPPYGIGECGAKNHSRDSFPGFSKSKIGKPRTKKIKSTKFLDKDWDFEKPNKKYFDEIQRISKDQIIFGGNYFADVLPPSSCWIVWDKDNGNNDFADCELCWTSFKTAVRKYKHRWNGMLQEDMKHKEIREHPTQKPAKLIEKILRDYSKDGMTIFDPFLGSGTTAVACINTGRNFIGIEKDAEYFEIAQKRIKKAQSQTRLF